MKRHDGEADGGSAFPSHGSMGEVEHRGMSLLDYFAGQALSNMPVLSDGQFSESDMRSGRAIQSAKWAASAAYRYADAMLAERERRKGGTNEKN